MPLEYLAIISPIAGLFLAFFPLRLAYMENQYNNFSTGVNKQKILVDKKLKREIKKTKPDKETVLNQANQIATFQHLEKDIKSWSDENRKYVRLDLTSFGIMILLGISSFDDNPLNQYFQYIVIVAILAGFFSVISFLGHLSNIINLKSKNFSDNKK